MRIARLDSTTMIFIVMVACIALAVIQFLRAFG